MRVLLVSNSSTLRCGVAEFGRMTALALRRAGCDVMEWDGSYSAIYEKPYLPPDAATYDVIHVNWHPVTINHFAPHHFPDGPGGPIRSLYLHDLPPWSSCPLWDWAEVRWACEPFPETRLLPYPAWDGPVDLLPVAETTTIGWTGVRGDGRDAIAEVCARRGWALNASEGWLGTLDEITRLSRSTVNVLWYSASGRGQSLALMTAAAARRPLLINGSTMFRSAAFYRDEIYCLPMLGLEEAIDLVLDDVQHGWADVPNLIVPVMGWDAAARQLCRDWERVR